ncbi:hypothetical protein HMPREF0494_0408 [Limosilactobacillus antri DSM 16041]|uniref:Uncharacterized protein n=1 Tax=Limosilactobacillus antri DSM 16041 TaxID=525309 RepID=C8P514_9LACO|nr:hypothetical protein HMPREF0494_0408 [Limosilactobacillus antri DSM 16041]
MLAFAQHAQQAAELVKIALVIMIAPFVSKLGITIPAFLLFVNPGV